MPSILGVVGGFILLIVVSRYLSRMYRNYQIAQQVGLPIVLTPIDSQNLIWLLFSPHYRSLLQRILPTAVWRHLNLTIFGWEFREKLNPFNYFAGRNTDDRSRSFILIGPGKLELWSADPELVQDLLTRARDFEVPAALAIALGQYGPNVMTTNGEVWSRHRRIVSSVLDERISRLVFEETINQTTALLNELFEDEQGGSRDTSRIFDMLKKISIHVLLRVGMGTPLPGSSEQEIEDGYTMAQLKSLTIAATNVTSIGIIPTKYLLRWPSWLPGHKRCVEAGNAKLEVERRSRKLLDQERQRIEDAPDRSSHASGPQPSTNIMGKLLQASATSKSGNQTMSDGEMISNLFVFAAAGFETTATTLAYAVVLLMRYPQWQDWLLEEVDELLPQAADTFPNLDYSALFPRATRIMAFMLETLRLYSAVPHVHRETSAVQSLQTSKGPIIVPANTRIYANSVALHILPAWNDVNRQSDPAHMQKFGSSRSRVPDAMVFRPSRWLNPPDAKRAIYLPPKGMFIPWAMGPRVCPGQKMAQVEFVAVMLMLLRKHRIDAVPLPGQDPTETARRLDARLRNSTWVTVLQMDGIFDAKGDDQLPVRFYRRR